MKICLINNLYKPFNRGGAERITEILFKGLKKEGYEVFVITTRPFFLKKNKKPELKKVYYLKSFYYNLKTIPFCLRFVWHFLDIFDFIKYFSIKKIIQKEKPDIVISGNIKGLSFLLPKLFYHLKIKHVHILHDIQLLHPSGLMFWGQESIINSKASIIYQMINSYLFNNISQIISPSKWLLRQHEDKGFFLKSQKKVIFNPILETEIKNKKVKKNVFKFLFVGHLNKAKGILTVLKAYEIFLDVSDVKSELLFVGIDMLSEKEKKFVSKLDAKILGRLNENQVKNLMLESNLLIMASEVYENSPTVIYEAVTCDLPFVSSKIGGAKELADFFGAKTFVPEDYQSLSKLMQEATKKTPSIDVKNKFKNLSVENYIKQIL